MTRTGSVSSPRRARCARVHLDTVLVAQVSQPAVSPTSMSAGCGKLWPRGGFGNPRYSRLGSLRYEWRVKYPGQEFCAACVAAIAGLSFPQHGTAVEQPRKES